MKIGIVSDTHNQKENLQSALDWLREMGVKTLIHCGDLTDPELIQYLRGFKVYYAFGNGDAYSGEIDYQLKCLDKDNRADLALDLELAGERFFVTHGHQEALLNQALKFGSYAYVICGHTHCYCDEKHGDTRVINSGALGGLERDARSFGILDTQSKRFERILMDTIKNV